MPPDCVVDTCLFIEYFRTKDKAKTWLARQIREGERIGLSSVVLFEILSGADVPQREFWKGFLRRAVRLPLDERTVEIAADIFRKLRQNNIRLESCDLFIAATAIANDLPVATLNRKHFEQIDGLNLITPN